MISQNHMIKFEEGEEIIKIVRRHYIVVLPMITLLIIAAIAPLLIYSFLISNTVGLSEDLTESLVYFFAEWRVFAYSVWLLLLWIIFFLEWTNYYLDLWVLTNRRIVDIDQIGFFNREVTSFQYGQIQDITVETRGFIETFLKYGTLHIQTAGHSRNILIRDAHYPEEARSLILQTQEKLKSRLGATIGLS